MKKLIITEEIKAHMIQHRENGESLQHIANMYEGASSAKVKAMLENEGRTDLLGRLPGKMKRDFNFANEGKG